MSPAAARPDPLRRNATYADLGPDHFDRTNRYRLAQRLARKLDELGYDVSLANRKAA